MVPLHLVITLEVVMVMCSACTILPTFGHFPNLQAVQNL